MTDPFDPSGAADPDELASAYLDGEAALDDLARVEADVDLLRRVETLGAVRDRLAVDSPPAAIVEAHVAAALAAFDERPAGRSATVTPLAARRRWTQRVPLGAVAAAVVVVALAVGTASLVGRSGDDADMATADAGQASGDDSEAADLSGGAGFDAAETSGADDLAVPRMVFDDDDALADYVRSQRDDSAPAPTAEGDSAPDDGTARPATEGPAALPDEGDGTFGRAADPCDAVGVVGVDPEQVFLVVPIVLDGADATAVAYTDGGADRLAVVRDATCEVTLRRDL